MLSTTTSASRLRSITPARSITLSVGLVGVSTQISAVSSRTAGRHRVQVPLIHHVYSIPNRESTLSTRRYVPP